jgi:hypothetical protein
VCFARRGLPRALEQIPAAGRIENCHVSSSCAIHQHFRFGIRSNQHYTAARFLSKRAPVTLPPSAPFLRDHEERKHAPTVCARGDFSDDALAVAFCGLDSLRGTKKAGFYCSFCDLSLDDAAELKASGLPTTVDIEDADPEDFYPEPDY